jgi:hypothetical protein
MKHLSKNSFLLLITFIFFLSSLLYCEKQSTPIESKNPTTSLTVEEVAVTEVWLSLEMENLLDKDVLRVYRDDSVIYTGKPGPADTTLNDNGLLPAQSYSYHASLTRNKQVISETNSQSITTMDTTSHKFTWTIDTIGNYGSVLYDVAMIDENDIWAVGEIHTPETDRYDSLGNWVPPFNAVHWSGQQWELKRIPFIGECSAVDYPPIRAIWAFSENHILFTNGGALAICDGINTQLDCGMNALLNGAISNIFALDPSNIYAIGGNGTIVHYYGIIWQKSDSGTDIDLLDITGISDKNVWVCGYPSDLSKSILLEYNGRSWSVKKYRQVGDPPDPYIQGTITNIWASDMTLFVVSGKGVYRESIKFGTKRVDPWYKIGLPVGWSYGMSGSSENNVFIVGELNTILHFSGRSWFKYPYFNFNSGSRLLSVSCLPNYVCIVGVTIDGKAIIFRGEQ